MEPLSKTNPKVHDITGRRFGKLVAERFSHSDARGTLWFCRCDCGAIRLVLSHNLITGRTVGCGCTNARFIECGGRCMRLADWARETGMAPSTILYRIRSGWSIERALNMPVVTSRHDIP